MNKASNIKQLILHNRINLTIKHVKKQINAQLHYKAQNQLRNSGLERQVYHQLRNPIRDQIVEEAEERAEFERLQKKFGCS